jgi:hypothetical protein
MIYLPVTDFLQQRRAPTVGQRQSLQSLDGTYG